MNNGVFVLSLVSYIAISFNLNAENDEFELLSKHVHGVAELTIVKEGKMLEVELVSPAANLWGFERAPKNAQEAKSINAAVAALENPTQFLSMANSQCRVDNITHNVNLNSLEGGKSSHAEHEAHEGHADHSSHEGHKAHEGHADHSSHEGHKAHEGHADHSSHEDHASHTDNSHPNVTVNYRYICEEGKSVDTLSFNIFKQFPSIQSVEVMFIKQGRQGAVTLDNSSYTIQF